MAIVKAGEYNIVVDPGIERKFTDIYLSGGALDRILKSITLDVVKGFIREIGGRILVIWILEGGKYYHVDDALRELGVDHYLGQIDIKSRFKYVKGDIATRIIKDYNVKSILSRREIDTVIIGETIASGRTLTTLIDYLSKDLRGKNIFILGFHTYMGVERVRERLRGIGVEPRIYSYGGLLGLGRNLTDMTLGGKPSIIPREIYVNVCRVLGNIVADRLCMIGDFTNSIKHVEEYIAERIIQLWEIGCSIEDSDEVLRINNLIWLGLKRLMNMGLGIRGIEGLLAAEYRRRIGLMGKYIEMDSFQLSRLFSFPD